MTRCWICGNVRCACLLAKSWKPVPEGQDAQPIWKGKRLSENEKRMENAPEFNE